MNQERWTQNILIQPFSVHLSKMWLIPTAGPRGTSQNRVQLREGGSEPNPCSDEGQAEQGAQDYVQ